MLANESTKEVWFSKTVFCVSFLNASADRTERSEVLSLQPWTLKESSDAHSTFPINVFSCLQDKWPLDMWQFLIHFESLSPIINFWCNKTRGHGGYRFEETVQQVLKVIRRTLSAIHVIKLNHLELIRRSWAQITSLMLSLSNGTFLKPSSVVPFLLTWQHGPCQPTRCCSLCVFSSEHLPSPSSETDDAKASCSVNVLPVSLRLTFPALSSLNTFCVLFPPFPLPPVFPCHRWKVQNMWWQWNSSAPCPRGTGFDC